MYAIVNIAGEQFRVSSSESLVTPRLHGEVGAQIEFDQVLLLSTEEETKVGTPYVNGVKVQATIIEHGKAKKVTIFRKKRRKGFKVLRGHRQPLTRITIDKILV